MSPQIHFPVAVQYCAVTTIFSLHVAGYLKMPAKISKLLFMSH